jgi:hypothetical protein
VYDVEQVNEACLEKGELNPALKCQVYISPFPFEIYDTTHARFKVRPDKAIGEKQVGAIRNGSRDRVLGTIGVRLSLVVLVKNIRQVVDASRCVEETSLDSRKRNQRNLRGFQMIPWKRIGG